MHHLGVEGLRRSRRSPSQLVVQEVVGTSWRSSPQQEEGCQPVAQLRRENFGQQRGGGRVVNSTSLGDCTRLPITEGRSSILESVPSLGAGRTSKFQECFEGCIFLELPFTSCLHFIVPQKESEIDLSRESQRFANRRFPTQLASREHLLKSFFGFCPSRKGFTYTPPA